MMPHIPLYSKQHLYMENCTYLETPAYKSIKNIIPNTQLITNNIKINVFISMQNSKFESFWIKFSNDLENVLHWFSSCFVDKIEFPTFCLSSCARYFEYSFSWKLRRTRFCRTHLKNTNFEQFSHHLYLPYWIFKFYLQIRHLPT